VKIANHLYTVIAIIMISLMPTSILATTPLEHETANNKKMACVQNLKQPIRRGLIVNWDCSEFFMSRPAEKMTIKGLQGLVDQYVGTQVSHIFFNPNAMRTNYDSKVWESFWAGKNSQIGINLNEKSSSIEKAIHNTRLLNQRGFDPHSVWIARCRERGISPWLSVRMNDIHYVDDLSNPLHSSFWLEHPEYWRVPGSPQAYFDRALDYGIKEVRDHQMALIRELLERYDSDGLELDWMRYPYYFRPGHEKQGAKILIEFTRDVRELLDQWSKQRGHTIKLGARIPAVPEYAQGLGLDGIAWAQNGLVDLLVLSPFWETADFDIPVERWKELLGPVANQVVLAAGMEMNIRSCPRPSKAIRNGCETMRGFAAAMFERGADQIYLFNHFSSPGVKDSIFHEAGQLKTLIGKSRRHIVTFHDTVTPDVVNRFLLPCTLRNPIIPAQFRIYTGATLTRGQVVIRIGLAPKPDVAEVKLAARMNFIECTPLADNNDLEKFPGSVRVAQFEVPLSALQNGYNLVELFLKEEKEQKIVWVEVYFSPDEIHSDMKKTSIMAEYNNAEVIKQESGLTNFTWPCSDWNGFKKYESYLCGKQCFVVTPKTSLPGKPWIWRALFFGHQPQVDIALLEQGFHLAYIDVSNLFGSTKAIEIFDCFYEYLTQKHGLCHKVALEALSRGGLIVYSWAKKNPEKVSCIYADAPVCDIRSWPGGFGSANRDSENWQRCLESYGINEAQATSFNQNPINNLEPLAKANIPLLHVCGDADKIVPYEENTKKFAECYRQLNGQIRVIIKHGIGHEHGLADPKPIVDFVIQHTP